MKFELITSAQNDAVKHLVKLRDRRHREREQLTILEGYRELTRAEEYGMELVECFFSPRHFLGSNEFPLLERLAQKGIRVREVAPHLLEKVTYRDRPEGLLAVAKMKRHTLDDMPVDPNGLYLVAETVEKPGNLGSMLRSADAVNATGVILCERGTEHSFLCRLRKRIMPVPWHGSKSTISKRLPQRLTPITSTPMWISPAVSQWWSVRNRPV